ncbi:MAG: DUF5700 domain-containing putative Zn-dependent protease [Candidatus Saliniplasma sp.]
MSQKIDLSGVYQFWELVSVFEKGEEPSDDRWDSLFETPGYKILTEVEFPREFMKKVFRKAFLCGVGETGLEKMMIEHLRDVRSDREELNDFLSEVIDGGLYDESVERALEWLPFDEPEYYPPVSFLFYQKDARGYVPIVFDLYLAYSIGKNLSLLLGHEMHHFYRNMKVSFDPGIEDRDIVWTLNQIHMEGIADQINKELIFGEQSVFGEKFQEAYMKNYDEAEKYISKLDELIAGYDPDTGEDIKDGLPMSGHPVGFFMVEKVIENGRKVELVENYADPFYFFELYSEVVGDELSFSEESLELVKELSRKYL